MDPIITFTIGSIIGAVVTGIILVRKHREISMARQRIIDRQTILIKQKCVAIGILEERVKLFRNSNPVKFIKPAPERP